MAYADVSGAYEGTKSEAGALRRWFVNFFSARADQVTYNSAPVRKLAGPVPGDLRGRGYLADLDIEVGF